MSIPKPLSGATHPTAIAKRYRELGPLLQNAIEGNRREAPPNWFALATLPSAEVAKTLESLEKGTYASTLFEQLPLHALTDPRVLVASALRVCSLLFEGLPLGELKSFLRTGSHAIDEAITPTMEKFLRWQESRLEPQADPDSLILYLGHRPERIHQLREHRRWETAEPGELAAVAATLYHRASVASAAERNQLVGEANLCLLYLEQNRILGPLYSKHPKLAQLFDLATPFVGLGGFWSFGQYARDLSDRDGFWWTAPIAERNWSILADRWPAILDYAQRCADSPERLWRHIENRP